MRWRVVRALVALLALSLCYLRGPIDIEYELMMEDL
jgi:hypothetical protein